jgi:hypothetical protein
VSIKDFLFLFATKVMGKGDRAENCDIIKVRLRQIFVG